MEIYPQCGQDIARRRPLVVVFISFPLEGDRSH